MRDPMLALRIAGGLVYIQLVDREQALVLVALGCLSVGIIVVQGAAN